MKNENESSIGKGIAKNTETSKIGSKFANDLLKELEKINNCDKEVKSLSNEYKIEINKARNMKFFNNTMYELQSYIKKLIKKKK